MRGRERVELSDQPPVAAERELGVDAILDGGETKLLEPIDIHARDRLELQIG
jgi:hypothetical protein